MTIRPLLAVSLVVALMAGAGQARQEGAHLVDTNPDTLDYVREIAKQGTLGLLCVVILWSYRRDFFRKLEDKDRELRDRKDEREQLVDVLEKSTAANTHAAIATSRQTDATHRLARTVEKLEARPR